ncbi:hypothetical protein GCK72_022396 [Caenorhabditis remanei]|uniref:Smr domain-containing protein n=1 Tax=Caenorhabditis remanei TaxID=31234 RepID=A0A6A5FTM4_CAERE|nr:hypothetical protein GCK72_022396 [Caenorhabditis remanei]KAF1745948.1 hypothetical protein GCK72_022396 [Caenorhabditis remanei]
MTIFRTPNPMLANLHWFTCMGAVRYVKEIVDKMNSGTPRPYHRSVDIQMLTGLGIHLANSASIMRQALQKEYGLQIKRDAGNPGVLEKLKKANTSEVPKIEMEMYEKGEKFNKCRSPWNRYDLHYLTVYVAVRYALDIVETEKKEKKHNEILLVTGNGNRSVNGVARIKNTIWDG